MHEKWYAVPETWYAVPFRMCSHGDQFKVTVMIRVEPRGWMRVRDGKWAMLDGQSDTTARDDPDLSGILEAVEMTKVSTSWTVDERERLVQGLQMYPHGPYEWIAEHIQTKLVSEVKSYGMQCWQSEKYQQFIVIRQQREQAARESTRNGDSSTATKRPGLGKWLRSTLSWCVRALSFRCLQRTSRHTKEKELIASCYDQEHTRDIKTEIPSRNSSDEATATSSAANQGASVDETFGSDGVKASIEKRRPCQTSKLPDAFICELQRLLLARTKEPCDAAPVYNVPRSYGYERSVAPNVLYDSQDVLNIRGARQEALDVKLGHARQNSSLQAAPTAATGMKNGPWGSEEHARYCEALEKYRYGSWKLIAGHVGTRTERQVMSHAQSIRAKRKRAEERERRSQNGPAPSKSRVFRHAAAPAKRRPEDPLNAPRILTAPGERQRTSKQDPAPFAASCASEQLDNLSATMANDSNAIRISTDAPKSSLVANGGEEQVLPAFVASAAQEINDSGKGCLPVLPTREFFQRYADEDVDLDDEAPLCSPPHDILRGSFLSDEDLMELLHDPPIELKTS